MGKEVDLRDGATMVMENLETMNLAKPGQHTCILYYTGQLYTAEITV